MAVHGQILEITYNHPDLGTGRFFPKSGEGNTYDLGGIRTEDSADSVTTVGDPIWVKNRVMGFFEVVIEINQVLGDDDTLNQLAESPVQATWTFSIINGTIYQGTGFPVGDLQPDVMAGTMTLKVGAGNFTKQ